MPSSQPLCEDMETPDPLQRASGLTSFREPAGFLPVFMATSQPLLVAMMHPDDINRRCQLEFFLASCLAIFIDLLRDGHVKVEDDRGC